MGKRMKKDGFIVICESKKTHELAHHFLAENGYTFKNLQYEVGFNFHHGFYIEVNNKYDINSISELIKSQTLSVNHELFWYVTKSRKVFRTSNQGEAHDVGVITAVEQKTAFKELELFHCPKTETYFILR